MKRWSPAPCLLTLILSSHLCLVPRHQHTSAESPESPAYAVVSPEPPAQVMPLPSDLHPAILREGCLCVGQNMHPFSKSEPCCAPSEACPCKFCKCFIQKQRLDKKP